MTDQGFGARGVEVGEFSPDFRAGLVFWVADEVYRQGFDDVFDDGKLSPAVAATSAKCPPPA